MDALDLDADDYQESMEAICNKIAELEESEDAENDGLTERAHEALQFFGVPESMFHKPTSQLSGGIRKKVSLASALMSRPQLLLLDEPTCHIDIGGILQLRKLIADCAQSNATIVLTSHDVDLMNDVATDTIHFDEKQHVLSYYSGNYRCFLKYRNERLAHQMKQAGALEKQRSAMVSTIDNLKKKSARSDSRQAKKKINKTIKSKTKKLERHGVEKNELGHRRTAQSDGGIRKGAINGLPAEQRNMSHKKLLKAAEINIGPVPDKAVQFDFEPVNCTWGDEPLVSVMDVGHSFDEGGDKGADFIFDCVDLSVREGTRTVILGENGSGKTSLLRIISGELSPTVGSVHFASGVTVAHFHQHSVDELMYDYEDGRNDVVTALTLLSERYPAKTEQDVRGMLTRFGLSPKQVRNPSLASRYVFLPNLSVYHSGRYQRKISEWRRALPPLHGGPDASVTPPSSDRRALQSPRCRERRCADLRPWEVQRHGSHGESRRAFDPVGGRRRLRSLRRQPPASRGRNRRVLEGFQPKV